MLGGLGRSRRPQSTSKHRLWDEDNSPEENKPALWWIIKAADRVYKPAKDWLDENVL